VCFESNVLEMSHSKTRGWEFYRQGEVSLESGMMALHLVQRSGHVEVLGVFEELLVQCR
jgi:hypothetical protein